MIKKRKWLSITLTIILMLSLLAGAASANNTPAATAIAGDYLRNIDVAPRWGTGRDGGNYLSEVAKLTGKGASFPVYTNAQYASFRNYTNVLSAAPSYYVDKKHSGYRDAVHAYLAARINGSYSAPTLYTVTFREQNDVSGVTIRVYAAGTTSQLGDPVTTNTSGTATKQLPSGSYWFTATRTSYQNYYGSFTVSGANIFVDFTMVTSPPPVVESVVTVEDGAHASAIIGRDRGGQVEITTNNLGDFGNGWTIEVIKRTGQNTGPLTVTINYTAKTIKVTLANERRADTNISANQASTISAAITTADEEDMFTASVKSSGRIIDSQAPTFFTGGENIELLVTWDEIVILVGNEDYFKLEGIAAAEVSHLLDKTTLFYDNVLPIVHEDELIISAVAVKNTANSGNNLETFVWDENDDEWK